MTTKEFVKSIERHVRDAAVRDITALLEEPPGRRPREALIAQSEWYLSLGARERELLDGIVKHAVDSAIFGFFCVLDGVRVVEDDPVKGEFELRYVKGSATTLAGSDTPMLHELYEGLSH